MTDRELLEQILINQQQTRNDINDIKTKVDTLETKVDTLGTKVDTLETKVDTLETKVDTLGTKVDTLETKINAIDRKVDRNYDKMLEFYGYQMESNTDMNDRFKVIEGKLEMHDNQIARNTADIRRIK